VAKRRRDNDVTMESEETECEGVNWIHPSEVFPYSFLSCKTNVRVQLANTGHGQHSFKIFRVVLCIVCFVSFCVLFVCKCVLCYCHRVATQLQFNKCIIYQFIDCMLYYVDTTPHTPARFFGLVPAPAASIHQHHKRNRLVEKDITVTRDEMFSEIYFDVVFKLPCNITCSCIGL
jgi:hypothetical protein